MISIPECRVCAMETDEAIDLIVNGWRWMVVKWSKLLQLVVEIGTRLGCLPPANAKVPVESAMGNRESRLSQLNTNAL